jgi:hypothetical protein
MTACSSQFPIGVLKHFPPLLADDGKKGEILDGWVENEDEGESPGDEVDFWADYDDEEDVMIDTSPSK